MPRFDAGNVWRCFGRGDLNLFMAVPTVYAKLIAAWQNAAPAEQTRMADGCRSMRLMVSGSAALPVSTLETWKAITGHVLLERYGMTEIWMALSNSYRGDRVAGSVGRPLPNVHVRRVGGDGRPAADDEPGEIHVRGPAVFREYWRRPDATAESFVDGWFRTGDIAVVNNGVYKILGRSSVDIIKTGGYKVSALEIEEVLREHHVIRECAVVGSVLHSRTAVIGVVQRLDGTDDSPQDLGHLLCAGGQLGIGVRFGGLGRRQQQQTDGHGAHAEL